MTKNIKSKFIIALTFIFAIAFAIGALGVYNVKATPQTFEMYQGASIRVGEGTDEDPIGIRFIATIASEEYNKLIEDYGEDNVEFGMRIAKCETVEELMLFPDEGCMKPVNAVVENQKEGVRVISIAIKNVSPAYYNTYFTALGYVKVTDTQTSQTQTYYANYTAGENSRTPFQVAVAHKLAVNMSEDDIEAEFINGIIDNVLKQGGAIMQQKEYVLAQNGTVQPFMEVAGVPVKSELKVTDENVAKIENGKLVAVGKGQTTLTATVSGYENASEKTATVIVKDSALAITYSNGVAKWSGDANKIVIDGVELDLEQGATSFDVAEYLKTNGFEEKVYTVAVKNAEVTSESVSITMKKVDNAEELLAISSGDANTYYVVTDNISLADSVVSVFGTYKAYIESLTGVLDVNGYAIYAINYKETEDKESNYGGLISKVNKTGVIKNGYFTGAISIKGNNNDFFTSSLEGTLENCYVKVAQFEINYPEGFPSGQMNYRSAQAILTASESAKISNCIFDETTNAGKPIVQHSSGYLFENVIAFTHKNSIITLYTAGAYSSVYNGYDKNNVYVYADQTAMFAGNGTIKKFDGTESTYASTVKVPYLGFSSAFDFDKEDGKIYMVNDKYGKMDVSVTLTVENKELDVVKDKYSPKISASISGIYGSDELTYTSSNTAVATVSADGTVTYAGNGTATITVTHKESGATATVSATAYGEYIGIDSFEDFISINGKGQYVYAELLDNVSITTEHFDNYGYYTAGIYQNLGTFSQTALIDKFSGTLNGNGKILSVVLDVTNKTYTGSITGVFSYITDTAVIKNLIYNFDITAITQIYAFASGNGGDIKNCYFNGKITTTKNANWVINVERTGATLENNIFNLQFDYQGNEKTSYFRLIRIASTYSGGKTTINNAIFITSTPNEYFYASQSSNNTTCYQTATNVSAYSSFADILSGTGYSITLNESDTTYKTYSYTALTETKYGTFSSAWTFSAQEGIKLCGTAIYTPA